MAGTSIAIRTMPPFDEMYEALCERDAAYEGQFFVGVWTTGVFCRPTCPARKPKRENIDFFPTASDALGAGFRPCKRCHPLEAFGTVPPWLRGCLADVEQEPHRRWTDAELRARNLEPTRVRRWFKEHHGMTFHAYLRTRRLGIAMGQINTAAENTTGAALANGYESLSGFREAFKNWFGHAPSHADPTAQPVLLNRILTPLGPMVVAATETAICLLEFADRRMLETQLGRVQRLYKATFAPGTNGLIRQMERELTEYFAGERNSFSVPIDIRGTEFQVHVWKRLRTIPVGQTISYDRLARDIGRPGAQRAVGRANGDNRLAIVIPCHRVIRSDDTLSGYGGGVWRKQWLLDHERETLMGIK
jgi:AraC family transcriptional regulator of adaptative response/methylated-DNA-[protein]-cysteine methyltransferase